MSSDSQDQSRPPFSGGGQSASSLPIDEVLDDVRSALRDSTRLLLAAPPGAGKTTRVPIALLDEPWAAKGRILLLEPRRLAARAAAQRLASELGSKVGDLVGLRMRGTVKTSKQMRIEVVTEGVLTRQLQTDPSLEGIAAVIFDEVHERHLVTDLGLALLLEAASAFRPDLRIIAMSATLDTQLFERVLAPVEIVVSEGVQFPIDQRWRERPERWDLPGVAATEAAALLQEGPGSVLVFLPGRSEIGRCVRRLRESGIEQVFPLYAGLSNQDRGLALNDSGSPRIVVSTAVAESSVTVAGVRAVVDGGLARRPSFHISSGLTRLVTTQVSLAEATQRAGRAGRLGEGRVVRLWSKLDHTRLIKTAPPEIEAVDLSGLLVELGLWGTTAAELNWPTPPPDSALEAGAELLRKLGAMNGSGRLTKIGTKAASLGLHPRLGVMLVNASTQDQRLACELAALLERGGQDEVDLEESVRLLRAGKVGREITKQAERYASRLGAKQKGPPDHAGSLLRWAYPDRIAKVRSQSPNEYLMANGRGVSTEGSAGFGGAEIIVVADTTGRPGERLDRVRAAATLSQKDFEQVVDEQGSTSADVHWDDRAGDIVADQVIRLGTIVVKRSKLANPPQDQLAKALLEGVRRSGLGLLNWSDKASRLRARLGFCHEHLSDLGWPDVSDEGLLADLGDWLSPYLGKVRRRSDLSKVDLIAALKSRVPHNLVGTLNQVAPDTVPSMNGRLRYELGVAPTLALRLQDVLGQEANPTIGQGRVTVRLELLNPAGRPLHITSDLSGFWDGAYSEVRGEMLGRYPKHYWPQNPREQVPENKKRRPRRH